MCVGLCVSEHRGIQRKNVTCYNDINLIDTSQPFEA